VGLARLADHQVHMSLAPHLTVTSLLIEALGNDKGSPAWWYKPVRRALLPADVALLGPVLGDPNSRYIPDCLLPPLESFAPSFDDDLERVLSTPSDQLRADIAAAGLLGSAWSAAASKPRRWLGAYASCLRRAWTAVEPLWEQARPLLDREVERVGSALARGTLDVLFSQLSPRLAVVDDLWFLEGHPGPISFGKGLVLAPLIGGPRALFAGPNQDMYDFCYPLPGAGRLGDRHNGSANGDSLEALLGEARAGLLRRLDRVTTAGSLAESMLYVPSAISHHLAALERAGLVRREREGRNVLVHRTPRGSAVMHLYSD
jgi:DNA-binding transcriptional ArsR family regulator